MLEKVRAVTVIPTTGVTWHICAVAVRMPDGWFAVLDFHGGGDWELVTGQGKSEEEFLGLINDPFWHSMSASL